MVYCDFLFFLLSVFGQLWFVSPVYLQLLGFSGGTSWSFSGGVCDVFGQFSDNSSDECPGHPGGSRYTTNRTPRPGSGLCLGAEFWIFKTQGAEFWILKIQGLILEAEYWIFKIQGSPLARSTWLNPVITGFSLSEEWISSTYVFWRVYRRFSNMFRGHLWSFSVVFRSKMTTKWIQTA